MTDELIILKNLVDGGEGFFKFEDGYRNMSVYAKGKDGKKYWCIADNQFYFGEMGKGGYSRIVSPCKKKPANCGVFTVNGGKAQLELFYGNISPLREGIEKYAKKSVTTCQAETEETETVKETSAVEEKEIAEEIKAVTEDILPKQEESVLIENVESKQEDFAPSESVDASFGEIKELINKDKKAPDSYWECNQEYFLEALDKNEPEEILNEFIPGSKWVKINDEDAEYVLGVIFDENEEPMYLCYGFNLPWGEEPPEKLEGYCQWIPVDCANPHENGYWVIYVNAKTGERIK